MLSESSYLTGLWAYSVAGLLLALYLMWCMRRVLPRFLLLTLGFVSAAWLLTPAYPEAGVDTFAPAVIVAGFQLLTEGVEAAQHAFKPLLASTSAAVVLALVMSVLLRVLAPAPRRVAEPEQD